jgi:L-threonylcarbamoyladenylate synthase
VTGRPSPITTDIASAAKALRAGKLVGIPTETVYGLAARADDDAAVRRIYSVKQRPAASPLIVHVADLAAARIWVRSMPEAAERLAREWWPGPLTMVLPAADRATPATRAGGSTIAIRVPNHPVTLELLRVSGLGLAAPSANPHTRVSPTTAAHVASYFDASDVAMILDGGPCSVGIESTIIDMTGATPTVLRWGQVTPHQIQAVLGTTVREQIESVSSDAAPDTSNDGPLRVPGQERVHYAPRARVVLATSLVHLMDTCAASTDPVAVIAATDHHNLGSVGHHVHVILATADANEFARGLYAALLEVDARTISTVVVLTPTEGDVSQAVYDRLQRAAVDAPRDRDDSGTEPERTRP